MPITCSFCTFIDGGGAIRHQYAFISQRLGEEHDFVGVWQAWQGTGWPKGSFPASILPLLVS